MLMSRIDKMVSRQLDEAIKAVCDAKDQYVRQAGKDFTRTRKLSMEKVMKMIISIGSNSLQQELFSHWNYQEETPTASAFVQARTKIKWEAFEALLNRFNQTLTAPQTFKGYRILAQDGTSLPIHKNPNDGSTYFKQKGDREYNLIHINTLYDVLNKQYLDLLIQGRQEMNEYNSLIAMAQRQSLKQPAIILADRGYSSFNVFEHLNQADFKYIIRCKDIDSNGFLKNAILPESEEFDITLKYHLTYLQSKAAQQDPYYRFLSTSSHFDFLKPGSKEYYPIQLRIVRLKIDDNNYQCLVTNLNETFTPNDLKELYHLRWGIETSFRDLKYSANLLRLQAKKKAFNYQEVYARAILYNVSTRIIQGINLPEKIKERKWVYQINVKMAIQLCRTFLVDPTINILPLVRSKILPIRPNRNYPRKQTRKSFIGFNWA